MSFAEVDVYTHYPSMNKDGKMEIVFNRSQLSKWQFKVKALLNSIPVTMTSNQVMIEILCGSEKIYVDTADQNLVIQPKALPASSTSVYDYTRFKSTNTACPIFEVEAYEDAALTTLFDPAKFSNVLTFVPDHSNLRYTLKINTNQGFKQSIYLKGRTATSTALMQTTDFVTISSVVCGRETITTQDLSTTQYSMNQVL